MVEKINLKDIYQHKLNFLIGSGASSGFLPTLALEMTNSSGSKETFEALAAKLEKEELKKHLTILFAYYYAKLIKPASKIENYNHQEKVIENYTKVIETIVCVLREKKRFSRRCNLFTTNYDACIPFAADHIIKNGNLDFVLNDGTSGFLKKTLAAKNFNSYQCHSGVFNRHIVDIPQINQIHLHGSVFWKKENENILVDYSGTNLEDIIQEELSKELKSFTDIIEDKTKTIEDIKKLKLNFDEKLCEVFWDKYNELPIVNPTKWKFYETVFEEHYYQMLRFLSYQLEEQNSVLITFGFSFADEHILNLVKRSLSNPTLQVFVCCYNKEEKGKMEKIFKGFSNVEFIESKNELLDFSYFNEKVFTAPTNKVEE